MTVGTYFFIPEIISSKNPINYTRLEAPEVFIIISIEGWNKIQDRIPQNSLLLIDSSLDIPHIVGAIYGNFDKVASRRGAALYALTYWIKDSGAMDIEALKRTVANHKRATILLKAIEAANMVKIDA